jgi:NAD-reducing hydrogenase large subunit
MGRSRSCSTKRARWRRPGCTSSSSAASSGSSRGVPIWEVPVAVQRLCGICPVSHHLAAAKAMDRIVGGEKLTPTAEKMRRLMHYGQMFQSHALHFFHLSCAGPAVRFRRGPGDPQRLGDHPEGQGPGGAGRDDAQVRAGGHQGDGGQEDPRHGGDPGGHQQEPVDRRAGRVPRRRRADAGRGRAAPWGSRRTTPSNTWRWSAISGRSTRTTCRSSAADGALDLYDGGLRAITKDGDTIFDHVDNEDYLEHIARRCGTGRT